MPKVSVVMPVYNASRFLNDSVNSILNQTLDDLELICVDDGSTDNSLAILNSFDDSRIKVYSLEHQGGGNARNYGLSKITGQYLFCMDADDLLNINALEEFYRISEEKNLDFLVFKAINYGVEKDHYFETEYQNMTNIYNKVKDNVFSYKDLGDLLFDFNVSPWCKFYNTEFIKSTGAKFRENSKFHDNQFFWDIIFKAERIYFINEFLYTRKRYDQSLTASGDIGHIDIIGVVNDIVKLFEKHNQLDRYKHMLYNLKITWITDRYNQVQEKHKREFFNKMKNDYLSLKLKEFPNILDEDKRFIYDCVIISKSYNDFDLIKQYFSNNENKLAKLTEDAAKNKKTISELNNKLQEKEKTIKELNDNVKNKEEIINDFKKTIIPNNEKTIAELNNKLQDREKTVNELNNDLKDKESTITDLNKKINENNTKIQNQEQTITDLNIKTKNNQQTMEKLTGIIKNKYEIIDELNNNIDNKNELIKNNTVEISKLENKNRNLINENNYLKNELDNRFSFKKLFKKK
ncbi:glycosyltransferase [uncultured Methanobrevibacter sp.]|uniref:glycosyltransferase n=1 Tax=uncultured Methanobrevibacter sp. TaxID=253161 RepID=UPI00261EA968|nr:glycosyltransferase [uncultured Methanobrevibacter sp.]